MCLCRCVGMMRGRRCGCADALGWAIKAECLLDAWSRGPWHNWPAFRPTSMLQGVNKMLCSKCLTAANQPCVRASLLMAADQPCVRTSRLVAAKQPCVRASCLFQHCGSSTPVTPTFPLGHSSRNVQACCNLKCAPMITHMLAGAHAHAGRAGMPKDGAGPCKIGKMAQTGKNIWKNGQTAQNGQNGKNGAERASCAKWRKKNNTAQDGVGLMLPLWQQCDRRLTRIACRAVRRRTDAATNSRLCSQL